MIEGFAFAGYGSFHGDLEPIGPMSKVHLVIGQNNTGKSNILRFAHQFLQPLNRPASPELPVGLDQPRGPNVSTELAVAIAHRPSEEFWQMIEDRVQSHQYKVHAREAVRKILSSPTFSLSGDDLTWVRSTINPSVRISSRLSADSAAAIRAFEETDLSELEQTGWRLLGQSVTSGQRGVATEDLIGWLAQEMQAWDAIPPVATIDALRSITAEGESDHSGRGLIKRLAQLERPGMDHLSDRIKFEEINQFVATVLEDTSARITIPADQDVIHVVANGVELPLGNLGTGLHEVIIVAAAATVLEEHLICIEEPEVHLHPVLQRRLLSYLATHTSNQYLIATHSAHMLDANLASVSHVSFEGSRSVVKSASKVGELALISADLGYRPSDLMQSNSVIWVEGPSDRVYLAHWLGLFAPDLIEGVHFSLMFYGGKLLSNLSASDQELREFIDLRLLNHNLSIVIDSDRKQSGQRLGETKLRFKREFESELVTGSAWITHGYTIENYVPPDLLERAAKEISPSRTFSWKGSRFENPLPTARGKQAFDKVAIARRVTEEWTIDTEMFDDLASQIIKLVGFVRKANS